MFFNTKLYRDLVGPNRLSILDGGARGGLVEPFRSVDPSLLFVIAFEPDPDAPLPAADDATAIFRAALWSHAEPLKIHVAVDPSTSSVFPADAQVLKDFDDAHGYPKRRGVRTLDVAGISLDAVLQNHPELPAPDLIKLDIHGAEYEAISGAVNALPSVVAVVVETWTLPIHAGQHVHCEVECLLYQHGFQLFHTERVMEMERKKPTTLASRYQVVGYENFYVNMRTQITDKPKALKSLAIVEAYKHAAYALQLTERFQADGLITGAESAAIRLAIARCNRKPNRLQKLVQAVRRRL